MKLINAIVNLCECGCGEEVNPGRRFINHHNSRCFSEETLKKIGEKVSKKLKGKKNPNMARIGDQNPFYGRTHSEDSKSKMSNAHKGMKHSEETKKKMSEVFKGEKSYMYGVEKSEEIRKKLSKANLGKKATEETKKKMSEAQKGEKGSNWRGGLSFIKYPQEWNKNLKENIRKQYGYACQLCGISQDDVNYKLHCHHIDYDKKNIDITNLVSLCRSCHMRTNFNREYWIEYFKNTEMGL